MQKRRRFEVGSEKPHLLFISNSTKYQNIQSIKNFWPSLLFSLGVCSPLDLQFMFFQAAHITKEHIT